MLSFKFRFSPFPVFLCCTFLKYYIKKCPSEILLSVMYSSDPGSFLVPGTKWDMFKFFILSFIFCNSQPWHLHFFSVYHYQHMDWLAVLIYYHSTFKNLLFFLIVCLCMCMCVRERERLSMGLCVWVVELSEVRLHHINIPLSVIHTSNHGYISSTLISSFYLSLRKIGLLEGGLSYRWLWASRWKL